MIFSKLRVLRSHGKQYIPRLQNVELPAIFRGRPELTYGLDSDKGGRIEAMCPSGAFSIAPFSIDLGRCTFCGECARYAPDHVRFTNDYRMATNVRDNLVITPGSPVRIEFDPEVGRDEICRSYGRALKLREVSAGGDNSCEMGLNASMNVNFDLGRYGIEFVASPRHADGLVITGPVTCNMADALDICYCSVAQPKLVIAAGCDAVSGGLFAGSPALDRSFFAANPPDLYLPGNPTHPITFIDGVLTLLHHGRR